MVFLSSESGDNRNLFYFVNPEWHKTGANFTNQIVSFLDHSALQNNNKTSFVNSLNKTLNALGSAMYHLGNYARIAEDQRGFLKSSSPPAKTPDGKRLVLIPDLQCEVQGFLLQIQRSFHTLPELMRQILAIAKDMTFGISGENIIDVFQEIMISDIADVRKHPIEKLIRLMEKTADFADARQEKRKPWLRFFSDFLKSAMIEEKPGLAVFLVEDNPDGEVTVHPPMFSNGLPLIDVLENTWETALEFHRDFYSLMVFWTLKPKYSFIRIAEDEQTRGQSWSVVSI